MFLLNPNGVVFGKNAILDIGGSFLVTTANAVQFGQTGLFSASQPNSSNLLTIDPSAFLFNAIDQQAAITNQGQLQVPQGESLVLLGGNVRLDQGSIQSLGGRVEIGGLITAGKVGLNRSDSFRLSFEDQVSDAEISLNQSTIVLSSSTETALNPGSIQIQGGLVTLQQGSQINSLTQDTAPGGSILIKAKQLNLDNLSTIGTITVGPGSSGPLTIEVDRLDMKGASILTTSSIFGQGRAGNLTLRATDSVKLSNNSGITSSAIGNRQFEQIGSGGDIWVITKKLTLDQSAIVSSSLLGKGGGGNLTVQANESIDLINGSLSTSSYGTAGSGGEILIKTQNLNSLEGSSVITSSFKVEEISQIIQEFPTLANPVVQTLLQTLLNESAQDLLGQASSGNITIIATGTVRIQGTSQGISLFSTQTYGSGNAGNLSIQTRHLLLEPGGWISTDALQGSQGNGGNLTINASESVELRGDSRTYSNNRAIISALTQGSGDAGNILLNAKSLTLRGDGKISSESSGTGNAGGIKINLQGSLDANYSDISTVSVSSSGGAIDITARDIRLVNESDIKTNVFSGSGNGGNITLKARSIIALDDSDILAFARDGKGGNVTLNTRAFFGQNYRPAPFGTDPATLDGNDRVDINASGSLSSGTITTPDTSFIQNSLNQLPKDTIDTTKLLSQTCLVRKDEPEGTFYIMGAGGLPNRPGDLSPAQYPTNTIAPTQTANRPWQKGDPIVEPTGFYQLANGRLVMSRECSQ